MPRADNSFESGLRKVIPAVLIYVRRDNQILMIHRNSKNSGRIDFHEGKWNGLGGKCEQDESPLEAARRELLEEAGLDLPESQFKALGVIQFPNFKPQKSEDWIVFVFTVKLESTDSGEPKLQNHEGDLSWIPDSDILSLNLWPGDRYFVPFVLKMQPFMGTIWYQGGEVSKQWIQPFLIHSLHGRCF